MNKCICILASTLLLCACSAEEAATSQREEIEVRVGIDAPAETRVNQAGNEFVEGDKFTLYMNGRPATDKDKADYAYVATAKWNTNTPLYWDDRVGTPFCAVSPIPETGGYEIVASGKDTYSAQADQSTEENYIKSDLLIARSVANSRLLAIDFKHVFCKVVVIINTDGNFKDADFTLAVVKLNNKEIKGEIDYSGDNSVIATAAVSGGTLTDVLMLKSGKSPEANKFLQYEAVIPQQKVVLDGTAILVTISGVSGIDNTYIYKPKEVDLRPGDATALIQGKQTTITITLKKTAVATGEITINSWIPGLIGTDDIPIVLPTN